MILYGYLSLGEFELGETAKGESHCVEDWEFGIREELADWEGAWLVDCGPLAFFRKTHAAQIGHRSLPNEVVIML